MSSASKQVALCAIDKTPPNDDSAIATLKDLFERNRGALSKIAATHLTPDRLAKIAINCVSKTPRLLECTPISILSSVMAGAAMGLEVGGPLLHGYLVPRFNGKKRVLEATFLPGYRGLIDLARRSGHVLSIEADAVYDADEWSYGKTEMGTMFRHVPSEDAKPGAVRCAYAVARLKDSSVPIVVMMTRRELDAIRDREKKREDSPWDTDYAEMAKKSTIRRICKYLPASIEMAECLDREADDEARDVIDILPAKQERTLKAADEPEIDASVSQERPEGVDLVEVLREIEALKTDAECKAHSKLLEVSIWNSDEDRTTALAAFKARWKVCIAEAKAAAKAGKQGAPAGPAEDAQNCGDCGAAPGREHHLNCAEHPSRHVAPSLDGGEIQGRERVPGEDDDK